MDDMDTCSEGMRDLGEEDVPVSPPPYTTTTSLTLQQGPLSPMCDTATTPADLMLDLPFMEPSPKYLKDK